jgi:hypothetical protein
MAKVTAAGRQRDVATATESSLSAAVRSASAADGIGVTWRAESCWIIVRSRIRNVGALPEKL